MSHNYLLCGVLGGEEEDVDGDGGGGGILSSSENVFICESAKLPKRYPNESRSEKRFIQVLNFDYLRDMPGQSLCDGMTCAIALYKERLRNTTRLQGPNPSPNRDFTTELKNVVATAESSQQISGENMPIFPHRGNSSSTSCFPVKNTLAANGGASNGGVDSPDNDSAFSDNSSMLSNESSSNTPSSGQQQMVRQRLMVNGGSNNVQKLCVKIFCADGSTKSVLLDHAMTAGCVLDELVEKNHVQLQPSWSIVEHLPELHLERTLEDHENVLNLLLTWRAEAKNKLLFIPRPERYDLFRRPEKYLLGASNVTEKNSKQQMQFHQWDQQSRQTLLQEIFSSQEDPRGGDGDASAAIHSLSSLEMEGPLWMKAEGKKNWKKYHFLLLNTGLYFAPKTGKGKADNKELVCLVSSFDASLIYYGVGWKKKYKAPTDFGFALKPPAVQMKGAKEIRYLCAENDTVLQQWVAVLRILKNQRILLQNYNCLLAKMQTGTGKEGLYSALRHRDEENQFFLGHYGSTEVSQGGTHSEEIFSNTSSSLPCPSTTSDSSLLSSSNNSVSSGCVSETSSISEQEVAGFDADIPDGGTIKRKPQSSQKVEDGELTPTKERMNHAMDKRTPNLPPPPSEEEILGVLTRSKLGGSDASLNSLPPPPEELRFPQRFPQNCRLQTGEMHLKQQQQQATNSLLATHVQQVSGVQNISSTNLHNHLIHPKKKLDEKSRSQLEQHGTTTGDPRLLSCQLQQAGTNGTTAIREQLYPCGVFRSVFPRNEEEMDQTPRSSQMALLKQMPNNAPPRPQFSNPLNDNINISGLPSVPRQPNQQPYGNESAFPVRKKKITFNERVQHIFANTSEPLKGIEEDAANIITTSGEDGRIFAIPSSTVRNPNPGRLFKEDGPHNHLQSQNNNNSIPPRAFLNDLQRVMQKKWAVAQKFHLGSINGNSTSDSKSERESLAAEKFANHYNEQDVSKWILQSLKHCHIAETDMSQDLYDIRMQNLHNQHQAMPELQLNYLKQQQLAIKQQHLIQQQRCQPPPSTLNIPHDQRPKIYNGRSVPNCFPPSPPRTGMEHPSLLELSAQQTTVHMTMADNFSLQRAQQLPHPPAPPQRNQATQLTSPR